MNVQAGAGTTRGWWQYFGIKHRGGAGRAERIRRIGAGLRDVRVDLAILLEVDGGSGRTGGVDQSTLLSDHSGLEHHSFFPSFRQGDRINQGASVHAAGSVEPLHNHRLPGKGEPRFLAEARVRLGGLEIQVFATHLSLNSEARQRQLEQVVRIVGARRGPLLLGGDFNAKSGKELAALFSILTHVPAGTTFPSWRPRWALDRLFVSEHFTPRRARVLTRLREADHLPALFDLEFEAGPTG